MRITLGELRRYIARKLVESGGGTPTRSEPYLSNPMSPATADREQLGSLADADIDTDDGEELPPHLREPTLDADDCWGPVPPTQEDPYVGQDPYVRDYGPLGSGVSGFNKLR